MFRHFLGGFFLAGLTISAYAQSAPPQRKPKLVIDGFTACTHADNGQPVCQNAGSGRYTLVGDNIVKRYLAAEEKAKKDSAASAAAPARKKATEEAELEKQQEQEHKREVAEAQRRGLQYAQSAETSWQVTRKKNEMTDQIDVTATSIQKSGSGVAAVLTASCSVDQSVSISALIVDNDGDASIGFPNQTSAGTIPGLVRENDQKARDGMLGSNKFRNQFYIAGLAPQKKIPSDLLQQLHHFGSTAIEPLDTTWRVMVQIETSQGELLLKIPVYDSALQTVIKACVPSYKGSAKSSDNADAGSSSDGSYVTSAGRLHAEGTILFVDDTIISNERDAFVIGIKNVWPQERPVKFALIEIASGGTACPSLFKILDVDRDLLLTPEFGNCSDTPKTHFDKDGIHVEFPKFGDAEAETDTYHDGKLVTGKPTSFLGQKVPL